MALTLRVVTDPSCRAEGGGRFALTVRSGSAQLPALEVAPLAGHSPVRLRGLQPRALGAPSPLADAVLATWGRVPWPEHLSRPFISPSLPVKVPVGSDRDVAISWFGSYVVEPDAPEEFEVIVDLHFAADPAESTAPRPADVPRHPGFLAIDFGTSNCTAVLYDDEHMIMRALDPAQVDRLREDLITVLTRAKPPRGTEEQLTTLLRRVARAVEPRADLTDPAEVLHAVLRREALADADRDITAYREPSVAYLVLLRLEREVAGTGPLRTWLRMRLHACYDAAFNVPPLESLQLFPVELDTQAASLELRSRVIVPASGALDEAVMPTDDSPPEPGARIYSGLKARIGRVDRTGSDDGTPGVDALVATGLRYMVKQSDQFIADNPKRFGKGRTGRVVATYPTVAPPVVRQKLHELLTSPGGPEMRQVVTAYDEAVAAAMFFLMREFSGQLEIGVEAAKSRYQQLPGQDRTWKQNVLVIDIGGGTTDIALLTMTLTDRTPPEVPGSPWAGRYYEVTPVVRGSSGFLQLGGEYLTLRIFRWLKGSIVDLLLATEPGHYRAEIQSLPPAFRNEEAGYRRGSLVERVLAHDDDRTVLDILESVVPTRWRTGREHEQAFWVLWTEAETAKLALGDPDGVDYAVPAAQVRQVVNATATAKGVSPPALDGLADDQVILGAAEFAGLLDGPLTQVMQRATNVVLGAFKGVPERLDRILLTGKSSAMPQVRSALTNHFGKRPNSDDVVVWEPSAIEVVEGYSKLATGLGAAFAQSIIWYRHSLEGAIRQLSEGKTHLDIRVENLFASLPAAFGYGEQYGRFGVRLKAGEALFQLDDEPVAKARSEKWEELTENVAVRRELDYEKSSLWASLNVPDFARDQGYDLADGVWPHQVKALLEIDQNTELAVLLCRGMPHYVTDGPTIDLAAALRDVFGPEALNPDGTLPPSLPDDVLVDALIAGSSSRDNLAVFRAEEPLEFDDVFFDGDHPTATSCPGLGGSRMKLLPPPRPGVGGDPATWTFSLHHPGGAKKIGTLPCPVLGAGQLPTRYLVTLDATGRLRVHAGVVPFRHATTMREVSDDPGRVLREKLVSAPPDYDEARDPFNGTH